MALLPTPDLWETTEYAELTLAFNVAPGDYEATASYLGHDFGPMAVRAIAGEVTEPFPAREATMRTAYVEGA